LISSLSIFSEHRPEIHCKHFYKGYPFGTPETNDLIIRDLYALSNNDSTKFADWVAYKIDIKNFEGPSRSRYWREDPWLDEIETLEYEDYKDAHSLIQTDRGHQAPLANFKGSEIYFETNYLSNITPQSSDLNQGPLRFLEEKERELANYYKDYEVFVYTGPYFDLNYSKTLPKADEKHIIPAGFWKIIIIVNGKSIKTASFIFSQDTKRDADFMDYLTKIDVIEEKTELDFLWELDDNLENSIESEIETDWLLIENDN
jgi:endonuclease G